MRIRVLGILSRARYELDLAARELESEIQEPGDSDIAEMRLRVDALESRVLAIEERGAE